MEQPDKKGLFTINQIANACSVSRATILRMEKEGLLKPVLHEDGGYRYYDTDNVMQAMQIYAMHRMGLTRKEIRPLVETPGDIDSVIRRLEYLRDNMDNLITDLKKRTLKDSSTVTELLYLPETLCYFRKFQLEGARYDIGRYLRITATDAIREGCRLDWDRGPFVRIYRPDFIAGTYDPGVHTYFTCVPVQGHPKDCGHIDTVIPRRILSVTWHGPVTDLSDRTLTLAASARERGLTPTGWFHLKVTIPMAQRSPNRQPDNILQMGCIVE